MARFVKFPGVNGAFVDTGDVNILDADTAHFVQDSGLYNSQANTSVDVVADAESVFGPNVARATLSGDNGGVGSTRSAFGAPVDSIPVLASTEYTVAMYHRGSVGNSLGDYKIRIRLRDGVTVEGNSDSAAFAMGGTTPVQHSYTFTTLATTDNIEIRVQSDDANGLAGNFFDTSAVILSVGASSVFVPSLRIVGDFEMQLDAQKALWIPAADESLIANQITFGGYLMTMLSTGVLLNRYGDGVTDRQQNASLQTWLTGGRHTIRSTFELSAGEWNAYVDGVLRQTDSGFTTAPGLPAVQGVNVGAEDDGTNPFTGGIFTATVRDGIDGPIVAVFDAEDIGL